MQQVLQLAAVFFAALATGGLLVSWIGLGAQRLVARLVSSYRSCGTRDRCDELCTTILPTISGPERI